jgi:hypothetical protein
MIGFLKNRKVRATVMIVVALIFLLWPLFQKGFFETDDGNWMIIRLSAFYQSLREGQFPVRFLGRLNMSFGYPVANFLYPGFLYIGSLFKFFGISFENCIKLIFISSTIASSFFLYIWIRKTYDRMASTFGTVLFILSPYLVFDIYKRGSVGEVLALIPITCGLWLLSIDKPPLFSFVIGLLIISHNTVGLFGFVLLLIIALSLRRIKFFFPTVLGIGISAFFWGPAMIEQQFTVFSQKAISNPLEYFTWGSNVHLLGFSLLIPVLISLYIRKPKSVLYWVVFGIFIFSIFLSLPISLPLWTNTPLTRYVQFPYRLLILSIITGAWLSAYSFEFLSRNYRRIMGFICILISLSIVIWYQSNLIRTNHEEGYYATNEATTTVLDEYMPKWVKDIPQSREYIPYDIYDGNASFQEHRISTETIDLTVDATKDSMIEIHKLYYPGWGAQIDGIRVPILYDNQRGIIHVSVPKGTHRLLVEFRETPTRFLFDTVTVISIIGSVIYIYFSKKIKINKVNKNKK